MRCPVESNKQMNGMYSVREVKTFMRVGERYFGPGSLLRFAQAQIER